MTLPPNCLPPENAALSGDLLAGLGQPAGPTETTGTTPFATLLADAAPAANSTPSPAEAAQAGNATAPGLYSRICYSNVLQSPTGEAADASTEVSAETDEAVSLSDTEVTSAEESALLLAYQLIAGQWVPQPVTPQPEPTLLQEASARSGDEAASAEGLPQSTGMGQREGFCTQQSETALTNPATRDAVTKVEGVLPANAPVRDGAKPTVTSDKTVSAVSDAPKSEQPAGQKSESVSSNVVPETEPSNDAAHTASATLLAAPQRPTNTPPAKFTAPGSDSRAEIASGVNPLSPSPEKKTLVSDIKGLKSTVRQVGTDAANRDYSMPYSAANKSSAPSVTALPQALPAGGMQSGTTTAGAEISAASSVHAPRLVQEIRAIADRISTIDRNTVEVRFDFNESDRLSVRVEYRDGAVHTTFRTDSDSLREVIAREWQVQAVSAEPRAYRVAEPVFSNNNASASADLSQSGHGSGQSQGRAFEQHAAPSFAGLAQQGRSASGASFGASSTPVATVRPETSLHLHTFA